MHFSLPPRTIASLLLLVAAAATIHADEQLEYNRDIRPILADYCFACHGADSAARQADLRLDQRQAAIDMGALSPGDAADSELMARVLSADPDLIMPPPETKKSLTDEQKEMLRQWIADGAEYQLHWSMLPPLKSELPAVRDVTWPKNAIDFFVLQQLESQELAPAPEADARVLFRRLHLDITGLPPHPADIEAFVRDYPSGGEEALSQWIDRLMQSPAWGEHRGRYWLDAARYADTHGLHFDNYREMWPYRDWVIRAFNSNLPFDEFTVQQLAGDLLPKPSVDQLIATGFQRCNITTNEGGTIDEENLALYASDRVQTFGWVYLGLTTNCCQCHDHKFDPLTMKDYYSLAAFFRNTTQKPKDGNVKDGGGPVIVVPAAEDAQRWEELPREIEMAKANRQRRRETAHVDYQQWLASAPATLHEAISSDGLDLHLPLNEGHGNSVAGRLAKLESSSVASDTSGPHASEATSHRVFQPTTFEATGELKWVTDGKRGPAVSTQAGSTLDLGASGDYPQEQGFSYGAWIRPAADSGSAGIIARMDEKNAYRGWDLFQQNRELCVHIIHSWPDNALKVATKKAVLKKDTWQHVFATYDGSGKVDGIQIYVDGESQPLKVEKDNLKRDASIRTDTALRLGQRSNGQFFNGALQDVRLFSRLLPADEVTQIYRLGPLAELLQTPAEERTEQQESELYDHYLNLFDSQAQRLSAALAALESEQQAIQERGAITHVQQERQDTPAMANILMRGEYDQVGEQVAAMTPAALHQFPTDAPRNRLGLAKWVVAPENPLTARVTVNRFWQEIFGQGLVVTAEDFGVMGTLPSHPVLLDWLAVDFRENGWNVKALFKQMLMSGTYRQAAMTTPEKLEKDPDNRWLSRGPRFRMAAEMVRDYALTTSGLLSSKMYGPSVKPYQPEDIWNIVGLPSGNTRDYVQDQGEQLYRRSVYTFWKRMAPPPNLEAFNAPSREVCTVRRERTNTPLQALVTLNDPLFVEAARHLAGNALQTAGIADASILQHMASAALGRTLQPAEQTILLEDQLAYIEYYRSDPTAAASLLQVGESPADEKLDAVQLAAWTMVANQILNLDEVLNK